MLALASERKQSQINYFKKAYDRSLGGPGLIGGTAEGIDRVLRLPLLCEEDETVVLEKLEDLSDIVVLAMSAGMVTIPGPGVFILLCDIDVRFTII